MKDEAYLPGIPAVLAIDPGISTGWAVLDRVTGAILGTGVFDPDSLGQNLDTVVRGMHRAGYALDVVIEKMPHEGKMSELSSRLEGVWRAIYAVVQETFDLDIALVAPGAWKPSRVARRAKLPDEFGGKSLVIHQRDAIRMGLYYIAKEGTKPSGD